MGDKAVLDGVERPECQIVSFAFLAVDVQSNSVILQSRLYPRLSIL